MNYETKFYIGLDVHTKSTQYVVRTWQGDVISEGKCATIYKDVKTSLEPYFHSCIVGMEACTSFYPLREGFMQDNVPVKIANVLRIRQLIVKLTATKSRIWAVLTRHGIKIPERSMFSVKGWLHVKAIVESDKCPAELKFLFQHFHNVESSLEQSTKVLIEYAKSNFIKEWEKLHSIDGIAEIISSYIIANVHPISRFANEKKLRRYAGVIPCFQESAGKFHGSMLPKTSSRALLRWALTQAAHGAIRKKGSNLSLYYKSKKKRSKYKAIMAVARSICDLVYMRLKE